MYPVREIKEIPGKATFEKQKDDKSVSECNKFGTVIKNVYGINITVLYKIDYDHVCI